MKRLIKISSKADIPSELIGTPAGLLLEYHNMERQLDKFDKAELLIGMCMDNRKQLRIPENFAYIIRSGGANLRYSEFKVSYAIAVGRVGHIGLIGHTNCGMVNLIERKEQFITGLQEMSGWDRQQAEEHFLHYAPMFEIGNEVDFVLSEAKRLKLRYPKITITPMIYKVEDNLLYLIG